MNPITDNPSALTLWQKVFLGALIGVATALLYHYAGNHLVQQNEAALGRYPGLRTRKIG